MVEGVGLEVWRGWVVAKRRVREEGNVRTLGKIERRRGMFGDGWC